MPIANRRQVHLENSNLRVSVLPGGGHIAAITLKSNGVNPLWDPVWETIDHSRFQGQPEYGGGAPAKLLCGIAGHNLCYDFFGDPSPEEAACGLSTHGEASTADWDVSVSSGQMRAVADLPQAGSRFERILRLGPESHVVVVSETAENVTDADRAVGWTEHVTLGPPFLAKGKTVFQASATASKVYEKEFANGKDRFPAGAEFPWPFAPLIEGGYEDLRVYVNRPVSGAFTTHLMNPTREQAFFTAFNPEYRTVLGYVWKREDFPWLGIWEENHCRDFAPWNGKSLTRGMEFGASPFPEPRRAMTERGTLFGQRGYRWVPARSKVTVEYCFFLAESTGSLETVEWSGREIRGSGGFRLAV
jgi:hypothetical protein